MKPRTALVQLGKMVALDMTHGQISHGLSSVGEALARSPGSVLEIVDLLAAESRKKRPNEPLVNAFAFMLGEALQILRYGVERGHLDAIEDVEAVRSQVQGLARGRKVNPETLLLVLRQFVGAKLELGDDLQVAMAETLEHHVGKSSEDPAGIDEMLEQMFRQVGGDIFDLQVAMSEQASAFPDGDRAFVVAAMIGAAEPAAREAAVAWVLDPGPATRRDAASLLLQAAQAGQVSGTMLRRLVTIRNWLGDSERPAIDSVIRACRLKGIEYTPLPTPEVSRVLATAVDGSRAQSFFAAVKDGRKRGVVAVLFKPTGIGDAWVNAGLSRAAADGFLSEAQAQTECFESSMAYLRMSLEHGLAVSRSIGVLPPFGLVDVVERLGFTTVQPKAISAEDLIAMLLDEVPANDRTAPQIVKALKTSTKWGKRYAFVESWFEDDAALASLLAGKLLSQDQQVALVMQAYLPGRRREWAELMARIALTLRQHEMTGDDWLAFALVAQELLGERPLAEIPVMTAIARRTVKARQARLF
jgi:hypothetical protein